MLSISMTKQQVLEIMGTETIKTQGAPPSIANPYKTETFPGNSGQLYEILFYYTDLNNRDGLITEDELTPIVIEDDKLIGWGDTALNYAKNQVEISL